MPDQQHNDDVLVKKIIDTLKQEYRIVDKSVSKPIYSLIGLGFIIGATMVIAFAVNRNAQFGAVSAKDDALLEASLESSRGSTIVPGEVLVGYTAEVSEAEKGRILNANGLTKKREIEEIDVHVVSVPEGAEAEVARALAHNPRIKFAEPNGIAETTLTPNDPSYGNEWHLPQIAAPAGWDIDTGDSSVVIAIIDSGINTHPDLVGKLVPGYNFISADASDTHDTRGHGTAVGGTASAATNNALGIAGVSWESKLMPLVVIDAVNAAYYSDIAEAMIYAADHGAEVINMSLAGSNPSATMQSAADYAWGRGVILVAAAGNNNTSAASYPAALNHVIAVSATDRGDVKASFSSFGDFVDVSAPGNNIYTTWGTSYASAYGTSFSSPIVAGLAALTMATKPGLTNAQIETLIKNNADDLGSAGFDQFFGWGRVNVARTLLAAQNITTPPPDTTAPTTAITAPMSGATVAGTIAVTSTAIDDVGVTRVELHKNGSVIGTDTLAPFAFTWNTTADLNGSYSLQTRAYDAAGNTGDSPVATVTVNNVTDTQAPTVNITQPQDGATLPSKGNVTLSATAADNVAVQSISIFFDGALRATCTNATTCSYGLNVRKVSAGFHTVSATASDARNNTSSASISVRK